MSVYVGAGFLLAIILVLGMFTYSFYRKVRAEVTRNEFNEASLYAAGEGADLQKRPRESGMGARKTYEFFGRKTSLSEYIRLISLSFLLFALMLTLSKNFVLALWAAAAVMVLGAIRHRSCRLKFRAQFDEQFARFLPQVAGSIRSSLTLERALRSVAVHTENPLREELVCVLADAAYGVPLAEAVDSMAQRTARHDVCSLACALRIQQRFGGSLAPVLELMAQHTQARLKTARELKTELAGTRLAKWFVAGAMPALFFLMFMTNADFAQFYQQDALGWAVMVGAGVLEVVGLVACHSITSVRSVYR